MVLWVLFDDYHYKSSILSSDHFIGTRSHSSREESSLIKISALGLCLKDDSCTMDTDLFERSW